MVDYCDKWSGFVEGEGTGSNVTESDPEEEQVDTAYVIYCND